MSATKQHTHDYDSQTNTLTVNNVKYEPVDGKPITRNNGTAGIEKLTIAVNFDLDGSFTPKQWNGLTEAVKSWVIADRIIAVQKPLRAYGLKYGMELVNGDKAHPVNIREAGSMPLSEKRKQSAVKAKAKAKQTVMELPTDERQAMIDELKASMDS